MNTTQNTEAMTAVQPAPIYRVAFSNRRKRKGMIGAVMGMPELIAVIIVGGILAVIGAATYTDVFRIADANVIYETSDRLGSNWKLLTQKCNVSAEVGASPIVASPSAANHLQLLVEGTGVNPQYQGCFQSIGLEPAATAGVKGTSGAYTVRGYPVTIANIVINNRNRVATTFNRVDDQTVLELVQQYGGQAGASGLATLPADDNSDPRVRFASNGAGYHNVTIIR